MIFVFLAVAGASLALHSCLKKNPTKIDIYQMVCRPGGLMGYPLTGHPYNKYAVWVWCDDGMGTSIGIIETGADIDCSDKSRFWRDSEIFSDIRSIEWSSDGAELTIYGKSKTYRLDLEHQKVLEEYDNTPQLQQ